MVKKSFYVKWLLICKFFFGNDGTVCGPKRVTQ
jgi:hypothetical protein